MVHNVNERKRTETNPKKNTIGVLNPVLHCLPNHYDIITQSYRSCVMNSYGQKTHNELR